MIIFRNGVGRSSLRGRAGKGPQKTSPVLRQALPRGSGGGIGLGCPVPAARPGALPSKRNLSNTVYYCSPINLREAAKLARVAGSQRSVKNRPRKRSHKKGRGEGRRGVHLGREAARRVEAPRSDAAPPRPAIEGAGRAGCSRFLPEAALPHCPPARHPRSLPGTQSPARR